MDQRINLERAKEFTRKNARPLLMLIFVLILLQDVFGTHGLLAMHHSKKQIVEVRQGIQKLDHENEQLGQRVKELQSNPDAIERIARDRMGLARPGEFIFRMPEKTKDTRTSGQTSSSSPQN